ARQNFAQNIIGDVLIFEAVCLQRVGNEALILQEIVDGPDAAYRLAVIGTFGRRLVRRGTTGLRGVEPDYGRQVVIRLWAADRFSFAVRTEIESGGEGLVAFIVHGVDVAARICGITFQNQLQPHLGFRVRIEPEGGQNVIV